MNKKLDFWVYFVFYPIVTISLIVLVLYPRTDVPDTKQQLYNLGYTPVDVGGFAWWYGGRGDLYRTKFTAKDTHGNIVTGAVTHGLWGRSYITFDK